MKWPWPSFTYLRLLQALTAGAALLSWWQYGRTSLGVYLALVALAVLELARAVWRLVDILEVVSRER